MNQSKISVRYAKALFELAIENNSLEAVQKDILLLQSALTIQEFKQFINSPIIIPSKKKEVVSQLLKDKISSTVLSFILLLIENKRESFLPIIIKNFLKLYREYNGIKEVEITTVIELDPSEQKKIINILKNKLHSNIQLQNSIKAEILGGFVIRIEDKMLDMSVKKQLQDIKKQLLK